MPLTDTALRAIKPNQKTQRFFDGGGLYLEVSPGGGKWWRLKYRVAGKEKRISLGVYPAVSLKHARQARDDAKRDLAAGVDPALKRKAEKAARITAAADSFEVIAREWFAKYQPTWAPTHASKILRRFERDLFPWIGRRPIAEVTAPELLTVLRRVESRGAIETAHRAQHNAGSVFRYAVATGRAQSDPTASLRGALPPSKDKHHASITDPKAIGELLRALHGYKGSFITLCALRLAPLVFVRPGELRRANWSEIDLDAAEWRIPAHKMKSRAVHIVPLSKQAVEILRELQPLTGGKQYVFPGVRSPKRPMSENTVLGALRRMGYTTEQMTGHGFRSMASTLLNDQGWHRGERDPVRAAYNYAEHLPERRKMMQAWADYLDALRENRKVVAGRFGRAA
jgi:integrase